jgi:hypothetical protein
MIETKRRIPSSKELDADTGLYYYGALANIGCDFAKAIHHKVKIDVYGDEYIAKSITGMPVRPLEDRLLEFSGMRKSTDNGRSQQQWPSRYQEDITGDAQTQISNWDRDLAHFRINYPDGRRNVDE